MSAPDLLPSYRFFCRVQGHIEGPFDIIELAGLLRHSQINAGTSICREGTESWFPFADWPEFVLAQQIPIERIARHLERKEKQQVAQKLPSNFPIIPWVTVVIAVGLVAILWHLLSESPKPVPTAPKPEGPAETFSFPKQYSATVSISANQKENLLETIYVDDLKLRLVPPQEEEPYYILIRYDMDRMFIVLSREKKVLELSFNPDLYGSAATALMTATTNVFTLVGTENNGGAKRIKYQAKTKKGYVLFCWLNDKNVPVEIQWKRAQGGITLNTFQTGSQDPDWFEPPHGYEIVWKE